MTLNPLEPLATITLSGEVKAREDISAIAQVHDFVVIGADEGVGDDEDENVIQLLKEEGPDHYRVQAGGDILLLKGSKKKGKELDIEGMAVEGSTVYVIGSHAVKRPLVDPGRTAKKNRKTFRKKKIETERNRAWLYRLTIDPEGRPANIERISLRKLIKKDPVLKPFRHIPSKENGVDIEGIAAKDGWLFIGFRGPVFRENYVPVMRLKFDKPKKSYELLFVQLDGRGFRDIKPVSDGFLILAGPVGDGPGSYRLYHWDGRDSIPGRDNEAGTHRPTHCLAEIQSPLETVDSADDQTRPGRSGKAEGVLVLSEDESAYELVVVFDGIRDNIAQRFRVEKKPA